MPTTDERVAYLEGRFEEHSGSVATVRSDVAGVRNDVAALRSDVLDVHRNVETLHQRLSTRMDGLDDKMSRQFTWLVGIQIAILIAVIGALMRVATS